MKPALPFNAIFPPCETKYVAAKCWYMYVISLLLLLNSSLRGKRIQLEGIGEVCADCGLAYAHWLPKREEERGVEESSLRAHMEASSRTRGWSAQT